MLIRNCCLVLAILTGCKQTVENPYLNYYPLKTGSFTEFDVTRTFYGFSEAARSTDITIKERMGDAYRDISGQDVFPVHYETLVSNVWHTDSAALVWQTTDKVMAVEHGETIVKLWLPVSDRNFWNGNAYNNTGSQRFEIRNMGYPLKTSAMEFPNTITVVRQNDSTLLSQRKYMEVYAEGVGLIRREKVHLNFCYETGCSGKAVISSGWREISMIKNYAR
jgi:hypothetical protein